MLLRTRSVSQGAAAGEVIGKDRQCEHWYDYEPGLDLMRLLARQVEQDRRNFDLKMEENREQFHRKMTELDEKRESRERRGDRRLTWLVTWIGIAAALVALIAAGSGSVGFDLLDRAFHITKPVAARDH